MSTWEWVGAGVSVRVGVCVCACVYDNVYTKIMIMSMKYYIELLCIITIKK